MTQEKNKKITELDQDIVRIQRSTRTLFPFFIPLHDYLRQRSSYYYNWHLKNYANAAHILAAILIGIVAFVIVAASIFSTPEVVQASTTTLRPNGDASAGWATAVPAGTHYTTIDESSASDADYISATGPIDSTDIYNMGDTPADTTSVTQVNIYVRMKISSGLQLNMQVDLNIGGSWQGAQDTGNVGTAYTLAGPFTYNGSWSKAQADAMQVKLYKVPQNLVYVSQMYATITYTGASAPSVTTNAPSSIATDGMTFNGNVTSDGGSSITARGFKYSSGGSCTDAITRTVAGTTGVYNYAQSSLSVNTQYSNRAYATNSVGTSYGACQSKYTLANAPSAPTVDTPTESSLKVTINENSNPASTEFAFGIDQDENGSIDTDGWVQAGGTLGASATWQTEAVWGSSGKTVTGLSDSTTYKFRVIARNGDSTNTSYSSIGSGTTSAPAVPPDPPSNVSIGSINTTSFTVSWTDNSSDEDGFKVFISTDSSGDCSAATYPGSPDYTTAADATSQLASGLTANSKYCAKVLSYNAAGGDSSAAYSVQKYTLADQVTGASATAGYDESNGYKVTLAWNLNGATTVRVAQVTPAQDIYTGGDSSYTHATLSANTLYTYRIYSKNNDGDENSNYVEVSDTTPPGAPSGLSSTDITPHTAKSIWDPVTDATAYEFCYGTNSDSADNEGCGSTGANEFYDYAGLSSGTTYYYKVRASNANGTGAWSNGTGEGSASLPYPSLTTTSVTKLFVKLPGQNFTETVGVTGDPTAQDAGTGFSFDVYATDDNNYSVTDETGEVSITSSDAQATLPANANLVGGTKSFNITLKTSGSQSVSASYVSGGVTSGSQIVTVNPDVFSVANSTVSPDTSTVYVGNSITLSVYIRDQYNNGLSGHTISVVSSNLGDSISYLVNPTNSSGLASIEITSNTEHTSTFTITDSDEATDLATTPQATWIPLPQTSPSEPSGEEEITPVISLSTMRRVVVGTTINFSARNSIGDIDRFTWNISDPQVNRYASDGSSDYVSGGQAIERGETQEIAKKLSAENSGSNIMEDEGATEERPWIARTQELIWNFFRTIGRWFGDRFNDLSYLKEKVYAAVSKSGQSISYTFNKTGFYEVQLAATGSSDNASTTEQVLVIPEIPQVTAIKNVGKYIVIFGTGTPDTQVEIFFSPSVDGAAVGRTEVNDLGAWTFAYPAEKFYEGDYRIYAVGVDSNKVSGDSSDKVDFTLNINKEVVSTSLDQENKLSSTAIVSIIIVVGALILTILILGYLLLVRRKRVRSKL